MEILNLEKFSVDGSWVTLYGNGEVTVRWSTIKLENCQAEHYLEDGKAVLRGGKCLRASLKGSYFNCEVGWIHDVVLG